MVNVVEASGGLVDMYFHVWGDQSTDINGAVAREAIRLAKEVQPWERGGERTNFILWSVKRYYCALSQIFLFLGSKKFL